VLDEWRKHRRLVPGTGAYLERDVVGLRPDQLCHQCDDVGLRDRLAFADREGCVRIGAVTLSGRNEQVARHLAHGLDDARLADASRHNLLTHHGFAGHIVRGVVQRSHLISATEARQGREASP
jgi:hypothetical protein